MKIAAMDLQCHRKARRLIGNLIWIYAGRLFACANTCGNNNNQWQFSLQVSDNEHILIPMTR